MITQRDHQYATVGCLYTFPPREGLRQVAERCATTLQLLAEADLEPITRRRLTASWRYVRSFVRFVDRCWAFPELNRSRSEIRHLHYVMLPNLLKEHIPTTTAALPDDGTALSVRQRWRAIWSEQDISPAAFAVGQAR